MFKFNIGDMVTVRQAIESAKTEAKVGRHDRLLPMIVTERIMQECPGGVQRHYVISGETGQRRVNEIEVVPFSEYDPVATFDTAAENAWRGQDVVTHLKRAKLAAVVASDIDLENQIRDLQEKAQKRKAAENEAES